jgi:hypothetical protein
MSGNYNNSSPGKDYDPNHILVNCQEVEGLADNIGFTFYNQSDGHNIMFGPVAIVPLTNTEDYTGLKNTTLLGSGATLTSTSGGTSSLPAFNSRISSFSAAAATLPSFSRGNTGSTANYPAQHYTEWTGSSGAQCYDSSVLNYQQHAAARARVSNAVTSQANSIVTTASLSSGKTTIFSFTFFIFRILLNPFCNACNYVY